MADRRIARAARRHGAVAGADGHPAVKPFKEALARDGISGDIVRRGRLQAEFQRLQGFVVQFTQEPVVMGPATTAVFDDPCSNLIQIAQKN